MSAPARPEDDDSTLCDAVREGDTAAFGVLFTRHLHAARGMARRAGADDVDDVVGEAFAATMGALLRGHGPGPSPFRPYLKAVIRHEVRRGRRRGPVHHAPLAGVEQAPSAGPHRLVDDPMEAVDDRLAIIEAAQGLEERHRGVLYALVVVDRPVHAVAAEMDLSPDAVRVLSWRARSSLRRAYLAGGTRPLSGGRAR